MPGPIVTDRMIASRGIRCPIWVSSGPGPLFPFSPSLWQARQPDWATISLPSSYFAATLYSIEFGEPATALKLVSIVLIIAGVIGLNLSGAH